MLLCTTSINTVIESLFICLPHGILQSKQCTVANVLSNEQQHRTGWLKVDSENHKNGESSLQELQELGRYNMVQHDK